jgi:predicted aldo/keto reductase-like oxidoreductase
MNEAFDPAHRRPWTRREFVKLAAVAGFTAGLPAAWAGAETERRGEMPYRALGRTGEKVSLVGLGGFHVGVQATEAESIQIIRAALDRGINFLDNCWDYNNGASEIRMGKALLDGYRAKAFLMSKIDGRTKESAARQIDESLRRLKTDRVDLMQFHEIIRPDDPARVFSVGGALEAMVAAQKAGKVRFIGFTGHKNPAWHLKMLEIAAESKFRFDAVQMPLNVMDAHFRSFEHQVVPKLVQDGIGILGMKSLGSGEILRSQTVTPIECLHYAMNLPVSTVITGMESLERLDQALAAARNFAPLNTSEVAALLRRTADAAAAGEYEPFKTTTRFDGTQQNPQWLG